MPTTSKVDSKSTAPSTCSVPSATILPLESTEATTVLALSVITNLESPFASANCRNKSESPRVESPAKNTSIASPLALPPVNLRCGESRASPKLVLAPDRIKCAEFEERSVTSLSVNDLNAGVFVLVSIRRNWPCVPPVTRTREISPSVRVSAPEVANVTLALNVVLALMVNVAGEMTVLEATVIVPPVNEEVFPPFNVFALNSVAENVPLIWPLPTATPPRLAEPARATVTTLLLIIVAI